MSNSLVFITGATGFIGSQIAVACLKAGYHVRLSVRREDQIQKLQDTFSEFSSQLHFVIISDFTRPDAFVSAVVGVEYVIHVASPMVGKGEDFQKDYIDPAVRGTLSVLDAAKNVSSIKRVLIMSSILALVPIGTLTGAPNGPSAVKEHSEDKIHVDVNMELPEGIPGHGIKYQGSKILAHQATADWVEKNKPAFPVLTFHPSFVTGPSLFQKKPEEIDSINGLVFNIIRTGVVTIPAVLVDVRDVADTFLKALSAPVPKFQEFIVSEPAVLWEDVAEIVQRLYPDSNFQLKPPVGDKFSMVPEAKAAKEILGIEWKPLEEVIRGVVDVQLALGA
ncbi:nad dependent epimerase dehydratase family protein [Colletotrichum truncatum]|uniref:Nad dependent epimerase dehydratase family protein n=1 Tax=Colletotrichum truncatum TaxID=5467 RepID=A0ACC3YFB5_COLTU|nr:nad dependent epimerase dehydratase family protein [Colletotrichum truncatum]KAF6788235.1 nad dependent epimerase dehydratase family protein [Colletotrichum truncatum]